MSDDFAALTEYHLALVRASAKIPSVLSMPAPLQVLILVGLVADLCHKTSEGEGYSLLSPEQRDLMLSVCQRWHLDKHHAWFKNCT